MDEELEQAQELTLDELEEKLENGRGAALRKSERLAIGGIRVHTSAGVLISRSNVYGSGVTAVKRPNKIAISL